MLSVDFREATEEPEGLVGSPAMGEAGSAERPQCAGMGSSPGPCPYRESRSAFPSQRWQRRH